MQTAVFGAGCFWGVEKVFWETPGVYSTAAGYAGGFTPNPTYEEVCSARTGHTEVVLVVFDPAVISYEQLLKVFWEDHDPTQGMRQGNDVGTQYRSAIYFADARAGEGRAAPAATPYQERLTAAGYGEITTEIAPLGQFFYAEDYHQQYLYKVPERLLPGALDGRLLPGRPPRRLTALMAIKASELFGRLRRDPDVEAPELVAVDATDRLLLDTAAELIAACGPGEVAVVDDGYGALTLGAVALHGAQRRPRAQDLLVGELALARNAERTGLVGAYRSAPAGRRSSPPGARRGARPGARRAWRRCGRSPRWSRRSAAPDVTVLVGGRVKHMTHAMNDVLRDSFAEVSATPRRGRSRGCWSPASRGRARRPSPRSQDHPDLGLTVCAHGAAFAGTKIDIGTRALLGCLDRMAHRPATALDLGCGTGVLAAALARSRPELDRARRRPVGRGGGLGRRDRGGERARPTGSGSSGTTPPASVARRQRRPRRLQPAVPRGRRRRDHRRRPAVRRRRPGAPPRRRAVDGLQQRAALQAHAAPGSSGRPRSPTQTPKFTVTVSTRR